MHASIEPVKSLLENGSRHPTLLVRMPLHVEILDIGSSLRKASRLGGSSDEPDRQFVRPSCVSAEVGRNASPRYHSAGHLLRSNRTVWAVLPVQSRFIDVIYVGVGVEEKLGTEDFKLFV